MPDEFLPLITEPPADAASGFDLSLALGKGGNFVQDLAGQVLKYRTLGADVAASNQAADVARYQSTSQNSVLKLQADKAVADAQKALTGGTTMFGKFDASTLIILLTIAGLAIAAFSIVRAKK